MIALRYPGGMEAVRHPEEMGCRPGMIALRYPGGMAVVRHPEEMGCRPGMIALRYPGGMTAVRHLEKMGCRPSGTAAEVSGWNERCHKLRTLKNYGNLFIYLTPRKLVLHSLCQVPTFLGMLMVPITENTKVKKGKKRRYRCTQKNQERKEEKTGKRKMIGG